MSTTENWNVSIFVPSTTPALVTAVPDDAPVEYHSKSIGERAGQVVEVSVDALKANWQETIAVLTTLADATDDKPSKWGLSEIEVGLTLSAKGQLWFIAEAGAEASVKFKLTRRDV